MRILVFSDIHLHNWQAFSKVDEQTGLNSRFVKGIEVLNQILMDKSEGADWVIFTGDLFEDGSSVKPECFYKVQEILRGAPLPKERMIFIPGQHDYSGSGGKFNIVRCLDDYVTVYDRPGVYKNGDITFKVVPNLSPIAVQRGVVPDIVNTSTDGFTVFLGHFLVSEVFEALSQPKLPSVEMGGQNWDVAFVGDYHYYCHVESLNLYSVGAAMHTTFRDVDREQGSFLIWGGDAERIFTNSPVFREIGDIREAIPNNYYMLKVNTKREWDQVVAEHDTSNILPKFPLDSNVAKADESRFKAESTDKTNMIKAYCDYMEWDERVREKGKEYVDKVRGE